MSAIPVGEDVPEVVVVDVRHHAMKNFNYLVVDPSTRQAVVVDPAWQIDKIEHAVAEAGATLCGVLITHSHADHIHLANPLARKYGCPIWMSKAEIAASGFSGGRLVGIDTTPWTVGDMLIEPVFTPGHTPGSTCYLIGDNLFTGDVLFAEGCGMCPDLESAHAMYASLERLKTLAPHTRIYPGHSYGHAPGRSMADVRRDNIYMHFKDKESFAAFRLRGGQDRGKLFQFR